jgi:putative colanic acid biosynthesis acetyltransferase WcaF
MSYPKYQNKLGWKNKFGRLVWGLIWIMFFRTAALPQFNRWRILLLMCFGAKIGKGCKISSSAKFWAPWNLEIGDFVAIGFNAHIYNPGKIQLGHRITISQRAHLCSASHDITKSHSPLITAPIIVEDHVWIAADTFIGMDVTIGQGAVVGATASVFKSIEPWTIVGGNPAKFIKKRIILD